MLWGCRDVTPTWNTYQQVVCAPHCRCGLKGWVDILIEGVEKEEVGSAVYYLSCGVQVSFSTGSQICGSWYLPMFLLSERSLTWMNKASLMFLILPCGSLCMMVKQSGLTGCPVVLLC